MGVSGITVTETVGFGQQKGHSEIYTEIHKGTEQVAGLVPKRQLTFYVLAEQVDEVIACLARRHAPAGTGTARSRCPTSLPWFDPDPREGQEGALSRTVRVAGALAAAVLLLGGTSGWSVLGAEENAGGSARFIIDVWDSDSAIALNDGGAVIALVQSRDGFCGWAR